MSRNPNTRHNWFFRPLLYHPDQDPGRHENFQIQKVMLLANPFYGFRYGSVPDPYHWITDLDPAIFFSGFQDAFKK
jgi:hypothetical protein